MKAIKCDLTKCFTTIDGKVTTETIGSALAWHIYNSIGIPGIAEVIIQRIISNLRKTSITYLSSGELSVIREWINNSQMIAFGVKMQMKDALTEQFNNNISVDVDDNWNPIIDPQQ